MEPEEGQATGTKPKLRRSDEDQGSHVSQRDLERRHHPSAKSSVSRARQRKGRKGDHKKSKIAKLRAVNEQPESRPDSPLTDLQVCPKKLHSGSSASGKARWRGACTFPGGWREDSTAPRGKRPMSVDAWRTAKGDSAAAKKEPNPKNVAPSKPANVAGSKANVAGSKANVAGSKASAAGSKASAATDLEPKSEFANVAGSKANVAGSKASAADSKANVAGSKASAADSKANVAGSKASAAGSNADAGSNSDAGSESSVGISLGLKSDDSDLEDEPGAQAIRTSCSAWSGTSSNGALEAAAYAKIPIRLAERGVTLEVVAKPKAYQSLVGTAGGGIAPTREVEVTSNVIGKTNKSKMSSQLQTLKETIDQMSLRQAQGEPIPERLFDVIHAIASEENASKFGRRIDAAVGLPSKESAPRSGDDASDSPGSAGLPQQKEDGGVLPKNQILEAMYKFECDSSAETVPRRSRSQSSIDDDETFGIHPERLARNASLNRKRIAQRGRTGPYVKPGKIGQNGLPGLPGPALRSRTAEQLDVRSLGQTASAPGVVPVGSPAFDGLNGNWALPESRGRTRSPSGRQSLNRYPSSGSVAGYTQANIPDLLAENETLRVQNQVYREMLNHYQTHHGRPGAPPAGPQQECANEAQLRASNARINRLDVILAQQQQMMAGLMDSMNILSAQHLSVQMQSHLYAIRHLPLHQMVGVENPNVGQLPGPFSARNLSAGSHPDPYGDAPNMRPAQ